MCSASSKNAQLSQSVHTMCVCETRHATASTSYRSASGHEDSGKCDGHSLSVECSRCVKKIKSVKGYNYTVASYFLFAFALLSICGGKNIFAFIRST